MASSRFFLSSLLRRIFGKVPLSEDPELKERIESHNRFMGRLTIVLASVFILILVIEIIPWRLQSERLLNQKDFARAIEISGNLRSLSQRISFLTLSGLMVESPEVRRSIRVLLERQWEEFRTYHKLLDAKFVDSTIISPALKNDYLSGESGLSTNLKAFSGAVGESLQSIAGAPQDSYRLEQIGETSASLFLQLRELTAALRRESRAAIDRSDQMSLQLLMLNSMLIVLTGLAVLFFLLRQLQSQFFRRVEVENDLRERARDLEQFSAAVAHDLKGPLQNIQAAGSILLGRESVQKDQEAKQIAELLSGQADRLSVMVRELLRLFQTSGTPLSKEKVYLSELVKTVKASLQQKLEDSEAAIQCEEDVSLTVDVPLFLNVLQNLFENSLKHAGKRPLQITVRGFETRGAAKTTSVVVKDDGVGIPKEVRRNLFTAFVRARSVSDEDGLGLGLALCRRIVNRHGGMIRLLPTDGTAFEIRLP